MNRKEEQKTKLSKKQIALIALAAILIVSNIAFALLYMTKDVTITGGVSVVGSIEVYEDDGVTALTSIDFPNFTGGDHEIKTKWCFINNTGNQPVYVYWNISASSIAWSKYLHRYEHQEAATDKYHFSIRNASAHYWWPDTEARILDVDQATREFIALEYFGEPNTAELFSFTVTFYARDA